MKFVVGSCLLSVACLESLWELKKGRRETSCGRENFTPDPFGYILFHILRCRELGNPLMPHGCILCLFFGAQKSEAGAVEGRVQTVLF